MIVGHYAAALALNSVERKASLWLLFLGVQFADLLFIPLVLAGIERMSIIPGFTESTHFSLDYMPYTHSLLASVLWSALVFALVFFVLGTKQPRRILIALVLAASVLSHWILDLIVHTPDLPLTTDASMKVGLGLWHNAPITFALETVLLLGGLWLYMRATQPRHNSKLARYGMPLFVIALLLINLGNLFGPPPPNILGLLAFAMVTYLGFAGVAYWLDRARTDR
jgi:hypothetical protein